MLKNKTSKAESYDKYTLRIWKHKHFFGKEATQKENIYSGELIKERTKEKDFFRTPAQLLLLIEKFQKDKNVKK